MIVRQCCLLALAVAFAAPYFVSAAPAGKVQAPDRAPTLVEERVLFAADEMGWFSRKTSPAFLTVRISPDKRWLLHSRPTTAGAEDDERGTTYNLWLRKIESGEDVRIPVAPYSRGFRGVHIGSNPFSPDGATMALMSPQEQDGNELVLYDTTKDVATPTGIKAAMVFGRFDRTGENLIAYIAGGQTPPQGLVSIGLPGLERKPLALGLSRRAYPTSVCPAADLISCFDVKRPPAGQRRGIQSIALCDLQKPANPVELPTSPENRELDDLMPVWTADGRYLCYHDQGTDPALPKGTRIWDRIDGREMTFVPGTSPVGTGPGASQIVLVSTRQGDNRGILLDVPSGKTWPLGDAKTRVLHAVNGTIAFLRFLDGDKIELRIATIVPKVQAE
jgi:hypothetical protein